MDTIVAIIKLSRLVIHGIFVVYLLGALFAMIVGATFDMIRFLFVYLILFTGTLSAMYNNNYNDMEIDRNATQTVFSGGSRILIDHPELRKIVKQLSLFFLAFSILLGLIGMVVLSYPITFFLFILIGNLLGWYYTAPPIQLIYHGLGEVGTMIAVGLLIPGLGYFALTGRIDAAYVPLMLPLMFQGFALSIYLQIPDREADSIGQKNTFVVRYGVYYGFLLGVVSSFFATLCFFSYGFFHVVSDGINYWLIAVFSLLPLFTSIFDLLRYRLDTAKIHLLAFRATASFFLFYLIVIVYFFLVIFL